MEKQAYNNLTSEAWEAELNQKRSVIPKDLTPDQALSHFQSLGKAALKSVARGFGNHVRRKSGRGPMPVFKITLPDLLESWIDDQIDAIDSVTGHVGSTTYANLANSMLATLRTCESHFRDLDG